ncbi:MAG: alanine glycine permease [Bacteroidetes bacterium GWC2_33_15]|nr:MAG: alanine glycine permease [Bacteroidetes bacterium GWA2_33_15]OFX50415.1 MAG: alanine glycine permease [Bacteroidetes bacterium GWC2_33_15]OFX66667.1 MAG: alanine glycine permease [Bacteroidetes bacterium GWB2_32_14]OFX69285.1 MAG: alanine glycine permease [Bacteroidetes bacterium GWD2_33_33]HAN18600.1 sodium:alanine symporter family protein [Bacteroidales bacterium]
MQQLNNFFINLHSYLGGHEWFVFFLVGTGIFFTFYLKFPQIRYFNHAVKIVKGKFDKKGDKGDTSHFQALTTALSGTVGTGNIAGVALAIHLGGPAALFWMLVTAFLGMCTKFVEVTLSHKYRDFDEKGQVAGGPMYYMKKRLNIALKNNKVINTGKWLGIFFAAATILSSFGSGSLPQVVSISDSMFATFGIKHIITGAVLSVLLALIIIGGIKRIAKVTEKLVPGMALIYLIGALSVIFFNYENIIPSFISIFKNVFSGTSAVGGFIGASFAFAFNQGVNRGLFSNEAGQGSAPIAHSAARAHEPVSEGMVSILEPFIDTIIICTLTGLVLLSSGVWNEKVKNQFQKTDIEILANSYNNSNQIDVDNIRHHLNGGEKLAVFNGTLHIENGKVVEPVTIIHARSIAENINIYDKKELYTGELNIVSGKIIELSGSLKVEGESLVHSAQLTTIAFTRGFLGQWGKYIVAIGIMLFAFSTAISWSYYGDRSVTFLFGAKYVVFYRILFVIAFFFASFTDTTIIWNLSLLTVVFMAIPNLFGILFLRREVKSTIRQYWIDFKAEHSEEKIPEKL